MKKRLKIPLKDYLELNGIALEEDEKQIVINGIPINYVACLNGDIYSYQMDYENPKKLKPIIIDRPENNKHNMETYNPDLLYRGVNLVVNGKEKLFYWHIIIAKTFIPNPYNLPQVNHKDGNKSHNFADNLEWCTPSQNQKHAIETGLKVMKKGEEHPNATITEQTAYEICVLILYSNFSLREISVKLSTTHTIVRKINKGIRWKHVSKQFNLPYPLFSNRKNHLMCSTTRERLIIEKYCNDAE